MLILNNTFSVCLDGSLTPAACIVFNFFTDLTCLCTGGFCWCIVLLAYIFCLWLPRWKLKVQQNLLHAITINQAQSPAQTWEEQTKAAFTCETVLQSIFRQVVLMYRYRDPLPIPLFNCYKQCVAISHTQRKLLKYQLVQM